jgi:hypothetical protein
MGVQWQYANNVSTTLSGGINNSTTSLTVASSTGFPTSFPFMIAMDDSLELIKVTNVVGTTWTVARGQESSTATSHTSGATIRCVITKAITDTFVQTQTGTTIAQSGSIHVDGTGKFGSSSLINASAIVAENDDFSFQTIAATHNAGGIALNGSSSTGTGVSGGSTSGIGVSGISSSNIGGSFSNSSTTVPTVKVANSSAGPVFQGLSGSTVTHQTNTDGTANLYVSPNFITNGNMSASQRTGGTTGSIVNPTASTNVYTLDRWMFRSDGSGYAITISQRATPANEIGVASNGLVSDTAFNLRLAQTTAGSSATQTSIEQRIEDVRTLAGQKVTLSFWAKADTSRTLTSKFIQNFGSGGTSTITGTAQNNSLTTSWQRFSHTVTLGDMSSKTIGAGSFLAVQFGSPLNTANQTIDITNVQLELGPIATPFRAESFDETLKKCLRYYQKSFAYSVVPATSLATSQYLATLPAVLATFHYVTVPYVCPMRSSTPTLTIFNTAVANNQVRNYTRANDSASVVATSQITTEMNFQVKMGTNTGWAAGDLIAFNWTADAEL